MKVKELIEELKEYDGELEVVIFQEHDEGYDGCTYGYEEVDGIEDKRGFGRNAIAITSKRGYVFD